MEFHMDSQMDHLMEHPIRPGFVTGYYECLQSAYVAPCCTWQFPLTNSFGVALDLRSVSEMDVSQKSKRRFLKRDAASDLWGHHHVNSNKAVVTQ